LPHRWCRLNVPTRHRSRTRSWESPNGRGKENLFHHHAAHDAGGVSGQVEKAGYDPIPPIAKGADLIHAEIIKNLENSDLVLCDMSCLNPNVFFEFGIRTSLNKPVSIVKDDLTVSVPFDAGILNHDEYASSLEPWELDGEVAKLVEHLRSSDKRSKGENTLWRHFGFRAEAKAHEGGSSPDAKLDYLMDQVDYLRQRLGTPESIPVSSSTQTKGLRDVAQRAFHFAEQECPARVSVIGWLWDPAAPREVVLEFTGRFPPASRRVLRERIQTQYGLRVNFRQLRGIEDRSG
jgi:hypothetical protein